MNVQSVRIICFCEEIKLPVKNSERISKINAKILKIVIFFARASPAVIGAYLKSLESLQNEKMDLSSYIVKHAWKV